jgi:4-amino-4-deoxy-L-arabinose transferase-like glycosyltransferase
MTARPAITWTAVAALLALHWLMAVSATRDKSTMFDEIAHLAAGRSYWLTGDIRLQPEGGILPQRWQALGLAGGGFHFPSLDQQAWWMSDAYGMGYHFFYDSGNDLAAMLLRGRAAAALLALPLGLLVFLWSRTLFGTAAGVLSLLLFTFSPTMLAHAPAMNSDTAAALFFTAATWALWVALHRPGVATIGASALAVAGLFASKNSAPIIVFVAAALFVVRQLARRPRLGIWTLAGMAAAHAVVVLAVVWTLHGFRFAAFAEAEPGRDTLGWETVEPIPGWVAFARTHRLLPEAYLYAYAYVLHHAQKRRAFLRGAWNANGWWSFFPWTLLLKTPLPLFVLLAAAGLAAFSRRRAGPSLYETVPLWALLAAYWAVALASHLNSGHRHILPTYPAMFVLAGGAAAWLGARTRVMGVLVAAAVMWLVGESFAIRPHYLAYFNQLAGGPRNGWRQLVDSSLDWGQDLPGLRAWLERNGLPRAGTPLYLSYFGTGRPESYGIESLRLPGYYDHWRPPQPWYQLQGGIYAISATMVQSVFNMFPGPWAVPYEEAYRRGMSALRDIAADPDPAERARRAAAVPPDVLSQLEQLRFARLMAYLRHREPDDQVGWSILIHRLSDADVRAALEGPPAELAPEPWNP